MNFGSPPDFLTFLFTDIEGSTRLWEQQPELMRPALARHDALARATVGNHRGSVVKMSGDGMHAVFADAHAALEAALAFQQAIGALAQTAGLALPVRCGLHAGVVERRDNDFFGGPVNRAARIMSAAHGGQVLLSQVVADLVRGRGPEGVTLRDLGVVRLRDLASPERVFQALHPRLRSSFPPLRSLESTPNNLSQQLTSFIGRESELAEIRNLLATTRLLTLHGAGGIGKTRLSLQTAADLLDEFEDGVWFVDLAPLLDARLVAPALASVLALRDEAGSSVQQILARHVSSRQLLIVLDNCEHVVQACAELARELLRASAGLKILATSREPLHIAGETTYPVPTLALPVAHGDAVPDWTQFAAMRLFVERAAAVQPAFRLTEENTAAIADICRRLDGIPLAIELAAARVRSLPVDRISERLADRFRLLTVGDRTALPRQQTLRTLIDWSWDLITAAERMLLRRLAVFAGGWTLEAAEAVGAGGELDPADILDVLSQLVEKSLVTIEAEGGRYGLLQTVREYALERLVKSGEESATRSRHLAHFLAFAEGARPRLIGPDQGAWLAKVDRERENLLGAHAWCDHAEAGAELGLRLAGAVKLYWFNRGLLGLGYRITLEALARPGAQQRNFVRCRGLTDAGQFGFFMGRYGEVLGLLEESLAIARELGDRARIVGVLQPLGMAYLGAGNLGAARLHLEQAVGLAQELGDKRELAGALNALAQLNRAENALDLAAPLYQSVVALARELGDRESIAIGLLNLAMVSIGSGAAASARTMLSEVLAITAEIGSKPAAQSALEVAAGLAVTRGEAGRGAEFFGAAEAIAAQTGLKRDPTDESFLAPLMASAEQALGGEGFAAACAAGRARTFMQSVADVRAWLAAGA